jgi:hypothetical protein
MLYAKTIIQKTEKVKGVTQITQINIDFSDENVDLQGSVNVVGEWEQYLRSFEQDMRTNFRRLFPMPEHEPVEGGEE